VDQKAKILSTIDNMTHAFHTGDLDGILRTYEPGAVVVGEPGTPVSGTPALRAMFAGFIAAKAHFTFLGHEVIQAEDVALHLTPWRMAGVAPDGTAVVASGLSVAVLRRQPDGHWLMVIDDPYGDALLNQPMLR
jgi:ketosteroid isomerase-like protein